jgi:hypothetical protein
LPDRPQLGTRLKFGLSHNFTERAESVKQNGVFVFFVALESTDDTILLEYALKKNFRMQRKCGTMEFLQLEALKVRFQEEHAKTVLRRQSSRLCRTSLSSTPCAQQSSPPRMSPRCGIAVTFDEEQMR